MYDAISAVFVDPFSIYRPSKAGVDAVLEVSIAHSVFTVARFISRGQGCIRVDVTRTGAIGEFAHRIAHVGIFVLFVRTRFVVGSMATGALGRQVWR